MATIGGHAYGSLYPGPMGAVLTPALYGIDHARDLPNASSFCGRCEEVCPMAIPLPAMMRKWRERDFERGDPPFAQRLALQAVGLRGEAAEALSRAFGDDRAAARPARREIGDNSVRFPSPAPGRDTRDLPAPQGKTFHELYRETQRSEAQ